VTRIDDAGDQVVVGCADGVELRGAGVVAADGLWSATRDAIVGDALIEEPYVAYRGTVPRDEGSPLARADAMVMWVGPGTHFVQYALRAGAVYNQVAVFRSPSFGTGDPDWGGPAELEAAFAGACDAILAGLAAIRRDRRWPMVHRAPAPTWTRNRVTLLGDSAHAMLQYAAQGACQAIEDAWVLALAVVDAGEDVPGAFAAYERARRPRASFVQQAASGWGDACHVDGVGRAVRNALLARAAAAPYDEVEWLYGYDATRPLDVLLREPGPAWDAGRVRPRPAA
jgi:salicylate hydroxylase